MTTTIDISTITIAIEELLLNNQKFENYTICRGEPINQDPANCPWIGIYRSMYKYNPKTLGAGAGHRELTAELMIVVQETSLQDGADCQDLLDKAAKDVVDEILTNPTIKSLVDMTNEVAISYSYDSAKDDEYEAYFQTAFIQLTMEGRTT